MFCTFAQSGLRPKVGELKKFEWLELMDVSGLLITSKLGGEPRENEGAEALDAEEDFKREVYL